MTYSPLTYPYCVRLSRRLIYWIKKRGGASYIRGLLEMAYANDIQSKESNDDSEIDSSVDTNNAQDVIALSSDPINDRPEDMPEGTYI